MSDNELDTTIDQWRAEMEKCTPNDPGLTIQELCEKLGTKKTATQGLVGRLVKDGKCKKGYSRRENNGFVYYASVYQILTPKKEKKR